MKLNILFLVIITALVLYMIFGYNGLLKYREMVRIKNNYELQISVTEDKVRELRNELKQVSQNVEYLEMLIKKELNLKRPDEELYIIEKPAEKEPEPQQEEKVPDNQ